MFTKIAIKVLTIVAVYFLELISRLAMAIAMGNLYSAIMRKLNPPKKQES